MFSTKEKEDSNQLSKDNTRNIFSASTKIVGEIVSDGDFRIDGNVKGSIKTKGKLVVGTNGNIEADIECDSAEIQGVVKGKIIVRDILLLRSSCVVDGEVNVARISMEPGASYNGNCVMSGTPKKGSSSDKKI